MSQPANYRDNVFINCPFDSDYHSFFEAIVFVIHDCGFIPRCAREEDDGGNVRIIKIMKIIDDCRYGIHDISKADLDASSGLARFNMPLELGLFMGAHQYAAPRHYNREKKLLVMDDEQYRYQKFISDLSGQDITAHGRSIPVLIDHIRNFLFNNSRRMSIAGGEYIHERFKKFLVDLPGYCDTLHWDRNKLQFLGYSACVSAWIEENPI